MVVRPHHRALGIWVNWENLQKMIEQMAVSNAPKSPNLGDQGVIAAIHSEHIEIIKMLDARRLRVRSAKYAAAEIAMPAMKPARAIIGRTKGFSRTVANECP